MAEDKIRKETIVQELPFPTELPFCLFRKKKNPKKKTIVFLPN